MQQVQKRYSSSSLTVMSEKSESVFMAWLREFIDDCSGLERPWNLAIRLVVSVCQMPLVMSVVSLAVRWSHWAWESEKSLARSLQMVLMAVLTSMLRAMEGSDSG